MNIDILARMRDVADTHNIAPVISQLQTQGYTCAIVCDTAGKAFQTLTTDFPHLLPITSKLETSTEMYHKYQSVKVYFGSMLPDNIGRDPFTYYKKQGALTATIQETPGWRLTEWETYPDIIFTMPGGKEIIYNRWLDYTGTVLETGMPQFEHITKQSQQVDTDKLRKSLNITQEDTVVSLNIPTFYTEETLSLLDEVVTSLPHTVFVCSIHPKASDDEKEAYRNFYTSRKNTINTQHLTPVERFTLSSYTIGSIASTTLLTASLCGSIPIGLTNYSAAKELYELGGYQKSTDFPYVKNKYILTARKSNDIEYTLKSKQTIEYFKQGESTNIITEKIIEITTTKLWH